MPTPAPRKCSSLWWQGQPRSTYGNTRPWWTPLGRVQARQPSQLKGSKKLTLVLLARLVPRVPAELKLPKLTLVLLGRLVPRVPAELKLPKLLVLLARLRLSTKMDLLEPRLRMVLLAPSAKLALARLVPRVLAELKLPKLTLVLLARLRLPTKTIPTMTTMVLLQQTCHQCTRRSWRKQ